MQGLLSQSLALSQQQQDESDGDGILSRYGSSHSLRPEQQQQQHNASATSSRGQQQGVARGQSTSALPTIAGGGGGGGSRTSVLPRASKRSAPAPADVLITKGRGGATRDLHAQKLSAVEELQALENSRLNVELDLESALRSVFTEILPSAAPAACSFRIAAFHMPATHACENSWLMRPSRCVSRTSASRLDGIITEPSFGKAGRRGNFSIHLVPGAATCFLVPGWAWFLPKNYDSRHSSRTRAGLNSP